MTQLEDQLRKAFRAKASEVTPPLPPLDLQSQHVQVLPLDALVGLTQPYQGHRRMTLTYPALSRADQLL